MNYKSTVGILKKLSVSYHYALKRLLGLPKRFSNHYACSQLDKFTLPHLMNFTLLRYYFWLTRCSSPCVLVFKSYFLNHSRISVLIHKQFLEIYNVRNVLDNDIDALKSRIMFVQSREPSSNYGLM